MFTCMYCRGKHSHVDDARACLAAQNGSAPSTAFNTRMVTEAQLDFITKLGGDPSYAGNLSRRDASAYIDNLKKRNARMTQDAPNRIKTKIPMDMLKGIQPGYYAMRKDENTPYRFYRVSLPKTGRFKGMMKIQSQHSEAYNMVMSLHLPTDSLRWYNMSCEDDILMLAVNQRACAVEYGQHIGRCCRCNKELTDERSRWFGIGPECEQHWPHVLDMVADTKGDYVPS